MNLLRDFLVHNRVVLVTGFPTEENIIRGNEIWRQLNIPH